MVEHKNISLNLSKAQWSKLKNAHKISIKPELIGSGIKIKMPSDHAKKLLEAKKKNKGIKLQLTTEQIEGSGIKDTLKKVWKTVKPVAAPLIRKGLKAAIVAAPVALGQPELTPVAAALADPLVDAVGKKVGFGLEKKRRKRVIKPKPVTSEPVSVGGSLKKKKFVEHTNQGILVPVGSVASYPKYRPDLFDTSKPDKSVVGRGTRANIRHHVPFHKEAHIKKTTTGGSFRPA